MPSKKNNPNQYLKTAGNSAIDLNSKISGAKAQQGIFYQFCLAVLLLIVYVDTLLPGIGYFGDTVKFQFAGKILGTPHPSGYPLYLLLNYLFTTLFPIGSLAYKANLLSALFSIGSCLVLFRIMSDLLKISAIASFVSALSFGLSFTLWSQSVVAEAYTLLVLFFALSCYFFILWGNTGKTRHFYIATAIYALSFGNHPVIITVLPALICFVFMINKKMYLNWRVFTVIGVFIYLSLAQYLYFIWRFYDPNVKYLEIIAGNAKELWWWISGAYFKSNMFSFSVSEIIKAKIPLFLMFFIREYNIMLPVIIYGAFVLRKNAKLNIFFILCICGNIVYSIWSFSNELFVYPLISYFVCAVYFGIGLNSVLSIGKIRANKLINKLCFVFPAVLFFLNIHFVSQSGNTRDAMVTESIIKQVGKDALIVAPTYNTAVCFWYYLIGENWGEKYNIQSTSWDFPIDDIVPYILENKPIEFGVRKVIPRGIYVKPGLTVYLCDNFWAQNSYRIQNEFLKKPDFTLKEWRKISLLNKIELNQAGYYDKTMGWIDRLTESGLNVSEVSRGLYKITK